MSRGFSPPRRPQGCFGLLQTISAHDSVPAVVHKPSPASEDACRSKQSLCFPFRMNEKPDGWSSLHDSMGHWHNKRTFPLCGNPRVASSSFPRADFSRCADPEPGAYRSTSQSSPIRNPCHSAFQRTRFSVPTISSHRYRTAPPNSASHF